MKILKELPPDWIMKGCFDKFRININHTFWTYGDTLYNPGGFDIPDHIIAHEEQHERQQAAYKATDAPLEAKEDGKDGWWKQYLADPRFRLEQEAEAYGVQYRFFCDRRKDRNDRNKFLNTLATSLSGPLYQVALKHSQARALILVLSGEKKLEQVT